MATRRQARRRRPRSAGSCSVKTIENCLAEAREYLQEHYDQNLRDFEMLLESRGATETEIEDSLAWQRGVIERCIAEHMVEVEGWLMQVEGRLRRGANLIS
jgi:hypothetical protein